MSDSIVFEILDVVLELEPELRAAYLEQVCADDAELRRTVLALIEASERSEGFLRVASEPKHPESIGPYRIVRELGRGSSGVVYLAEDDRLRRQIALKTFPPGWSAEPSRKRMLREEARALAALTQPNVAHVYSLEEAAPHAEPGAPSEPFVFITMELVDGVTLAERLWKDRLCVEDTLEIGRQIAAAIEAAHRAGLVHRDLKPQNVMITTEGWVKVLDFGLATLAPDRSGPVSEVSGANPDPALQSPAFQGTPGYMSPEQIEGGAIDERADVWAFGCILFECLAGHPAIEGHTVSERIERTKTGTVEWHRLGGASAHDDEKAHVNCVPRVEALLRRCLDPDVDERLRFVAEARRVIDEELLRIRSARFAYVADAPPRHRSIGRLPVLRGEFVGREEVLRDLENSCTDHRLMTITGFGGAGKTRTALELGLRVRDRFPDGVWFVELAELTDGRGIAETVARVLDLRNATEGDLDIAVLERLCDQSALIIVDNCEHVADEVAAFLSRLLDDCPRIHVVATSREALNLPGEQVHPLGPMRLPDDGSVGAEAAGNEAVRLFATRARARHPSFALDDQGVALVARICRRLDGLPLAIELAAGQIHALSLEELTERIGDSRFLTSSARSGVARHQSLDELIEWSHRLLNVAERAVFTSLSIFPGGWSLGAAEAVCAGDEMAAWEVCPTLARLVEKSLVEADTTGSRVRYRFLESVREFAARHLAAERDPASIEELKERFVEFYLNDAEPLAMERGWTDATWLARVQLDYGNLRRALEISRERLRVDWAMRLAVFLTRRAVQLGHWRQCQELAQEVLDLEAAAPDPSPAVSADRVLVLVRSAQSAAVLDDLPTADALLEECFSLSGDLLDPAPQARVFTAAGVVEFYRARFDVADDWQAKAERVHRELDDKAGLATNLAERARIRSVIGRHDEARAYYRESLELHRAIQDQPGAARVLMNLGRTAHLMDDHGKARALIEEALAAHRETDDSHGIAVCMMNLGDVARNADHDLERARACYGEAMQIRSRGGQKMGLCSALLHLALVATDSGQAADAAGITATVAEALGTERLARYDSVRTLVDTLRSRVETELGPAGFRRAWDDGCRVSLDQLVERLAHEL